jgi:hypothetical protein
VRECCAGSGAFVGLTLVKDETEDVDRDTDVVGDERLVGERHETVETLED